MTDSFTFYLECFVEVCHSITINDESGNKLKDIMNDRTFSSLLEYLIKGKQFEKYLYRYN